MRTRRIFVFASLLLVLASVFVLGPRAVPNAAHAQMGDGLLVDLADGWNIGAVTSGSAVFGTDLKPSRAVSYIRIGVVLGSTAQLSIKETDGTHTFTSFLNGGTTLTAGTMYTFVWECRNANGPGGTNPTTNSTSFNFVVNGPTTVPVLRVTEITAGNN